ncbi:MAG: hypothetical protein ACM3SU_15000 [Acidobacteriota bacterium]
MKRRGALALAALLVSGALAADAVSDTARAELARERRLLAADTGRLAEVTRRLETALSDLAAASRAVSDSAGRADAADEVTRREEALSVAEQETRSLLDRRRLLAERVVDRRRRVSMLEAETQTKRPGDLLNGRWAVVIQPGEQRGVFRLSLQGAIVSGEYVLEGGYSGSLRGTLVNDRLKLERVDSKLGFNAVFYGRLSNDGREIAGTWEATTFGTGEGGSGSWKAAREEEKEESP